MGRASAAWAASHPCYVGDGYRCCICKHFSGRLGDHNKHVIKNHTEEEAEMALSWKTYMKTYKPNEYKEYLKEARRKKRPSAISEILSDIRKRPPK